MRWRPILLAVTYFAVAALTALAPVIQGSFDCYESCRYDLSNPPWQYDDSAWQSNAMFWLGLWSGIASIAFVVTVFHDARLASTLLDATLAAMIAGGLLLRAAGDVSALAVALVVLAMGGPARP